jgi:hypothetical protein
MARDYIPSNDGAFLDWAKNLITDTTAHVTEWHIEAAALAALQPLLTAFETAFTAFKSPNHGKEDTLNKNDARDALKAAIRSFVKANLLYNPVLTSADRDRIGIPIHDNKRSPVPPPSTYPEGEVDTSMMRQLTVHVRDAGSTSKGKPDKVHGVEIRWDIRDIAPVDPEELTRSAFSTRSSHTLHFSGEDEGKRVYFCLRWENNKGDEGKGPWGAIFSAIVP